MVKNYKSILNFLKNLQLIAGVPLFLLNKYLKILTTKKDGDLHGSN